ncbi:MAG: ABC transporter substrate-binding protein [Spartobacteria bacterium]|nr:ABC transporter substrate-binding protein [Spartobacteria bacterium]
MKLNKLAIASALVAACALTASAKELKIGFSNRTLNGPYFSALSQHIKQYGEAKGYDVTLTEARGDLNKQMADCEDMMSKGIDYLILNPQDPKSSLRIVAQANEKGIPVVIVDSDISTAADVITRVIPDNVGNNLAIGGYCAEQFGKTPIKLALISGNQGNLVGKARRSNFILGIIDAQLRSQNKSSLTILTQIWGGWDQQGGMKAMEDILVGQPEVNAIYCENDDMALGAIRALRGANKLDQVKVYSYDGNKHAYKAIMNGQMEATGENNPDIMANWVIETISRYDAGDRSFPDYSITPILMVNKENAAEVYKEDSLF